MFHKRISPYLLAAWLITAMMAPLASLAGTVGWLPALALGAVLMLLCWGVTLLPQNMLQKSWYCALQFIWLAVLTGILAGWSDDAWPTGTDYPVVPLILLLLAVFAAFRGADGAAKVGGVLFWFVAALFAVVLLAGAKNVDIEYLTPQWRQPGAELVLALLLPAAVSFLPRQEGKVLHAAFGAVGLLFAVLTAWTVGALSANVAESVQWPFYEAAKALSLFGIAERFEAVVSVAVTMGYFSLYSLLLSAAGTVAARVFPGWGGKGTAVAGVIAAMWLLFAPEGDMLIPAILTLLLWCLGPIPGLFHKPTKSAKKPKNNP